MEQSVYMEDIKFQLFSTPILRVLDFLLQHSEMELSDAEITDQIKGVKRAAVHQALTRLDNMDVLRRTHRDRRCYNALNITNPWLIYFKITSNILTLMPLVNQLKDVTSSIVLFGSRADGTNRSDSDFDVVIISADPGSVNRIAKECEFSEKLQLIIKTPMEMLELESNEPVLAAKIRKGIILWEK